MAFKQGEKYVWAIWVSPAVVFVLAMLACSTAIGDLKAQSAAAPQVKTVSIPVEGMSCVSCAARVKRTLKGIEGVQRVEAWNVGRR